jgi:hypothetical protein
MRLGYLVLAVFFTQACGCSFLIMRSGEDVSTLENQSQVRERFGTPDVSGENEGVRFDSYHTRRKIDEQYRAMCMGEGWAMTSGAGELVAFPVELYRLCRRTIVGEELQFSYGPSGNVTGVTLDGTPVVWSHLIPTSRESNTAENTAGTPPSGNQP